MRAAFVALFMTAVAGCGTGSEERSASRSTVTTTSTARSTVSTSTTTSTPERFVGSVTVVEPAELSSSWRPGCPVPIEDLRLLSVTHWRFDGTTGQGQLVVHGDVADDVLAAMRAIYDARFPIERIELVDVYGGDDARSMEANNTSAFNCRAATGSTRWSEHAFGRAIDINPVQNPYVTSRGTVEPAAGRAFVDRAPSAGVITSGDAVVRAFADIGWSWGGDWTSAKDYQHFSRSGR